MKGPTPPNHSLGQTSGERGAGDTLAGGVGFLLKGSEDPNTSDFVPLKKSSDEVPLKGSLSLNGSPPKGSTGTGRGLVDGFTGMGLQTFIHAGLGFGLNRHE